MNLNGREYPDWLNSLRGNSPLLERSELEFIAEVRNRINHETRIIPGIPVDRHLRKKLSTMEDNFMQVVNYLRENSRSKNCLVSTYPMWRAVRDSTILQLKEIGESVNKISRDCLISRGTGSSVSLVGGVMSIIPGNSTLRILGSVMMGLGSLSSARASVVELELLRKKIKKAEEIIDKDRKYSEEMWRWISDGSYIQEALDTIRYIDVDVSFMKAANDLHTYYKKKNSSSEAEIIIQKVLNSLEISPEIVKEISEVIGMLVALSMLYDSYRLYFNWAFEAFKCNKVLSVSCDVLVSTIKTTSAVSIGKSAELTGLQKCRILTGIALDAINIFLVTQNVTATSKEAKAIFKSAEKLKEEAKVFEKLYNAVNC